MRGARGGVGGIGLQRGDLSRVIGLHRGDSRGLFGHLALRQHPRIVLMDDPHAAGDDGDGQPGAAISGFPPARRRDRRGSGAPPARPGAIPPAAPARRRASTSKTGSSAIRA
jgi:hypothetical protein